MTQTNPSDDPEIVRLRVECEAAMGSLTVPQVTTTDLYHALSLIDALKANVAEKERIIHALCVTR